VHLDLSAEVDRVSPSWQLVSWTKDGKTWAEPRRCYLMDRDFWQPTEFEGRYYVACDNTGHVPPGRHCTADLLTSDDGLRWTWVSQIMHGSATADDYTDIHTGERFGTPTVSEVALHFFPDGRLLTIARARGLTAVLSLADAPYVEWQRRRSEESRCYGAAVAQVGRQIVVTGRSFDNEGRRTETDEFPGSGLRTGVFVYEDGDLQLRALLPSGGDTGYAGIVPLNDRDLLIAYYSSHEYGEGGGSNVYLASLSLDA
jgi:hypothetical protein